MILSIILGWNLTLTVLAIGLPTALYTMVGGVQAVTWTDVKQMAVIVAGRRSPPSSCSSRACPADVTREPGAAPSRAPPGG